MPLWWTSATRGTGWYVVCNFCLISAKALAWAMLGTVTRTISQPISCKRRIPATDPSMSRVSSLIIDCTTTGLPPPMVTLPTLTGRVLRRLMVVSKMGWLDALLVGFGRVCISDC